MNIPICRCKQKYPHPDHSTIFLPSRILIKQYIYSYGQKSCRVKCLGAIYAHTLWKAISPEPLGLQYFILHIWNLCVKTNNLSTFGGLYDPPLKSSYNLKNKEKKIKIVKNRFFFPLAQF